MMSKMSSNSEGLKRENRQTYKYYSEDWYESTYLQVQRTCHREIDTAAKDRNGCASVTA